MLANAPPWLILAAFLGLMHAAGFHLVLGRHVRQLPLTLGIGIVASVAGGYLGTLIPPSLAMIGETNLIATGLAVWAALGIARLFRFC